MDISLRTEGAILMKRQEHLTAFRCRLFTDSLAFVFMIVLLPGFALAAPTTSLTVRKVAVDGTFILAEKVVDYVWLMDPHNIPVMGDGVIHYYHQGPVFVNHPDEKIQEMLRWNPEEDINADTKDMGALKGTRVKDLCELVGGMAEGDLLNVKASDGLSKTFAYENVYCYSDREGPMVICWYKDGKFPDTGYRDGMRLVWFADDSTNPWGLHVFGNWDWHEAADEEYWYYFHNGDQKYPTTTGLSVQSVSLLTILSRLPVPESSEKEDSIKTPLAAFTADITEGRAPFTVRFEDRSDNSPTQWGWDFDGDGEIDDRSQNPSYTYLEPGTYSVRLIVSNDKGSDEALSENYIVVLPGKFQPKLPAQEGLPEKTEQTPTGFGEAEQEPDSTELLIFGPTIVIAVGIALACVAIYYMIRRKG